MITDFTILKKSLKSSGAPIYETLIRLMSGLIQSGEWQENSKLPADKLFAAELGINHITLARALNELRRRGLLERRRKAGTFVLAPGGDELTLPERKIAVVFDDANEATFHQGLFLWLNSCLEKVNCSMMFYSSKGSPEKQMAQLRQIVCDPALAGCIVWPVLSDEQAAELLRERPAYFPLVLMDRFYPGFEQDAATYDNFGCGRDVAKFMQKNRIEQIVWLDGMHNHKLSSALERREGLKSILGDDFPFHEITLHNRKEKELDKIIASGKRIGLISSDYICALDFHEHCHDKLALFSATAVFETDMENHAKLENFTAFQFDSRDLAQEAVKILSARINGHEQTILSRNVRWAVIPAKSS